MRDVQSPLLPQLKPLYERNPWPFIVCTPIVVTACLSALFGIVRYLLPETMRRYFPWRATAGQLRTPSPNPNHAALKRRPRMMTTPASRATLQCPRTKAFALTADGPTMTSSLHSSWTAQYIELDQGTPGAERQISHQKQIAICTLPVWNFKSDIDVRVVFYLTNHGRFDLAAISSRSGSF